MKIIACIKQVPDTETRIKLKAGSGNIDTKDVKFIINPYDEFALEEALRVKEKIGGEVTVITLGPPDVDQSIRECFARGVDNGIRVVIKFLFIFPFFKFFPVYFFIGIFREREPVEIFTGKF